MHKRPKIPTWKELIIFLEKLYLDDAIGHLFVVDISFNVKEPHAKHIYIYIYIYNEIYYPMSEKQKNN